MNVRIILVVATVALLAGCAKSDESTSWPVTAQAAPPLVSVVTVAVECSRSVTEITGTVQAVQRAQLAAKITGTIETLRPLLGEHVRAGDIVLTLTAPELTARVAEARSLLDAASQDLTRERGLLSQGASARESVRTLEDRVRTNEAQLRAAEAMLDFAVLRAPFAGVVVRRFVNAGDLATPGSPLLEIHGTSAFEIEAAVPETAAARLSVGDEIPASIPATSVSFAGKLSELSSAADPRSRSVLIKLAVPPGAKVQGGQFARLQVPGETRSAIEVPASAVTLFGQMERVFTVSADNRVTLRLVKTGGRRADKIEVIAGLTEGDRVLAAPPPNLREGQLVSLQR